MTPERRTAVCLVTLLVTAAGLPLAVVTIPVGVGPAPAIATGTAAAQATPTARCGIVAEAYPEPGDPIELNASDTTDAEFVEFDLTGNGSYERGDETDFAITTEYDAGTYEPRVRATNGSATDTADCGTLTVAENTPPNGSVVVDTSPLVFGDPERFVANASDDDGTIESYEWRVDGQFVTTGRSMEYEFPEPGNYTVTLRVTDDSGATDTANASITVRAPNRAPVARIGANRTIVTGNSSGVALSAANSSDDGSIVRYAWDLDGDGSPDVTGSSPRTVAAFSRQSSARTVVVTLTVTDDDGATDTARLRISVAADRNQPPTAAFAASPPAPTPGDRVTLDAGAASDSDGSIAAYEWDLDGDGAPDAAGDVVTRDASTLGEVTLTVIDDEGATDTVSRRIETQSGTGATLTGTVTINVSRNLTTTSYVSLAPRANFSVTPSRPEPGDSVRFKSTSYDPDGTIEDRQWYLDGSPVDATGGVRDLFGSKDYSRVFNFAREYDVELVVTDDSGAESSITRTIDVKERQDDPTAALSVRSGEPNDPSPNRFEVGENLRFDGSGSSAVGSRSITDYDWEFVKQGQDGRGFRARAGRQAALGLNSAGTWTVTLRVTDSNGETDSVSRNITIAERGEVPRITNVTQDPAGKPLSIVDLDLTYEVDVLAADPVQSVEFRRGGQTYVDRDGSDGWTHTLNPTDLPGDQTMTVTVTDADGQTDTETVAVDLNEPPVWARTFLNPGPAVQKNVTITTDSQDRTVVRFDFVLDPIATTETVESGFTAGPVSWEYTGSGRVEYVMPTGIAYFDGGTRARSEVLTSPIGGSAESGVEASGVIDTQSTQQKVNLPQGVNCPISCSEWKIRRGVMRGNASFSISVGFRLDFIGGIPDKYLPKAVVTGTWGFGFTEKYADRNGELTGVDGQYRPMTGISGQVQPPNLAVARASGEVGASLKGFFPVPPGSDPTGLLLKAFARGEVRGLGFSKSFQKTWEERIGNTRRLGLVSPAPTSRGSVATEQSAWELREKHLGGPPGGAATAARALGIDATPRAAVGSDRLTTDTVADRSPAVAYDGNYTALWIRQDPEKNVSDGFDVYASRSRDGKSWSQPAKVSDDRRTESQPSVVAGGDRLLAAWVRANESLEGLDGPVDTLSTMEITYAVRGDDGWSTPAGLTDDDAVDLQPAVAATSGRFLVAWVSDPDDINTTADRRVRYAVSDGNGTLGRVRTIPNATAVDVTGDDGAFAVAYLESDDGANGTVVHATVAADGSRTVRDRYPARNVASVAVAGDRLAWLAGDRLRFVDGNTVETASVGGYVDPRDLELVLDGGTPVATYRAVPAGTIASQVVTRRRGPDGWLPPQRLTASTPAGLSVIRVGTAAGDDELVAVATARNRSIRSNADVFAVRRAFAPDLAITAEADADLDATSAGDRITVDYTVRNVGDRAVTRQVPVTVANASGTLATTTLSPLEVGERATGSFRVRVDASGAIGLAIDPSGTVAERNESNNRATVATARPDLAVGAITEQRIGSRLLVEIEVTNSGPVAVADAVVQLRSDGVVANRTVDVRPDGTRIVRVRLPVDAINQSLPDAVVVDPHDRIAERSEANNRRYDRLLGVDLAVTSVGTVSAPNGSLADVYLANADTGDATATVTLGASGRTLRYALPIDGASTPSAPVSERVRLYHPATGGTLNVTALPAEVDDPSTTDNAARTAVNVSANDTAPVPVTGVDATATNGTATVTVTLSTDADVATGVPVTVSTGARTLAERTAVVPANDSRTVEVRAEVGDASTLTVATPGNRTTASLTAAPDVNGNGLAATDLDGDGLFEDVDGNGEFTVVDVAVLLARFDRSPVQDNAALFDFDGNGGVNIVDVAVLLDLT